MTKSLPILIYKEDLSRMINSVSGTFVHSDENLKIFQKTPLKNQNTSGKSTSSSFSAFDAVDRFLDLNSDNRLSFLNYPDIENNEEFKTFIKIIANLIKNGIVGYEYLKVNNRPYRSFLSTQIGDQNLYGKKVYKNLSNYSFLV